jgi:hypothetical protein
MMACAPAAEAYISSPVAPQREAGGDLSSMGDAHCNVSAFSVSNAAGKEADRRDKEKDQPRALPDREDGH